MNNEVDVRELKEDDVAYLMSTNGYENTPIVGYLLLGTKLKENAIAFSVPRKPNRIQRYFMWNILGLYYMSNDDYQKS